MSLIARRDFLRKAAFTGALVYAGGSALRAASPGCKIEVLLEEPIGEISPGIYSHFAEHIFNRHADKVIMANIAQLINNLQSLFLAHEAQFIVTPNYHVFEMYAAHQGGQSLRTVFSAPGLADAPGLAGLAGSASLHGKRLVLSVVNPSITETRETEVSIRGAGIREAKIRTLSHDDIHGHNSFDHPEAVTRKEGRAEVKGSGVVCVLAPASVNLMTLELA
jgi:alpha-L-arabinofuranosidase